MPAKVSLLNVVLPTTVCVPPSKLTSLALGVKVAPVLVQLPHTESEFDPAIVRLAPELIVILLQVSAAFTIG